MRSARDLPVVLGTVCRAPGEAALRTIWLAPQHDAALTHRVRNTDHCGCVPVTKNIHTHACMHVPGGLRAYVCEVNVHTSLNTLHRDAWAAEMLSELIQALRCFNFLRHLKHILERGGAKASAIIDHRVWLPTERLAISKRILCNHLSGSSSPLPHQVWALKRCCYIDSTPPATPSDKYPSWIYGSWSQSRILIGSV